MAYSLTVAGYTFENPPEDYRKLARLSNSPQPAIGKESTAFYQSDSQDLQLQIEGTLALDPPLGETSDDTAELERLQQIAIDGGEVAVEFDPFFSGRCVIEDDPFRQSEGESSYSFTFTINSETTDDSAYPAHSTPDTGNTFELGSLNLGYDPREVTQNYERQTEKVKRLQGIARSVDNEGLIPKITVSGFIDGGGQATLWDKARSNVLAYLTAEFQNGWVLIDSLSIRNSPEAPDYLEGLFRYDLDVLVVMDPGSGIGEVSKYVDQEVKGTATYVSDCDSDGVFERLGDDSEDYPEALDYRVSGGTGKLDDRYTEWQEDFGTLDQSTTNYIWVEDGDADGYGEINTGTSGFPGGTIPLYEVDTGSSSVNDIRDQRTCLTGSRLEDDEVGDLNFTDDMELDDPNLDFERLLRLSDTLSLAEAIGVWRGFTDFADSLSVSESDILWQRIIQFQDLVTLQDGGSADTSGVSEALTWETDSDWDNAVSEDAMQHAAAVLSMAVTEDDFEENLADGDPVPAPWGTDGSAVIDNSRASSGSLSVDTGGNSATRALYTEQPDSPIDEVHWRYNETSNQSGADITILNENGNRICRMGTGNPQRGWWHGNGDENFGDPNDKYNAWYEFWCEFDWANDEVTFHWRDRSGSGYSDIDDGPYPMENASSKVSEIHIGGHDYNNGAGWSTGDASDCWHDLVTGSYRTSSLTTATKTFSNPAEPNLTNLDYTLNGQTITVDVIGSPGTASEETVSQILDGSESYDLDWNDSHTDFRVKVSMDTGDRQTSPTANSITVGSTSGSDSDQNPETHWEIFGAKHDTSGNEYEGGGVTSRYGAD